MSKNAEIRLINYAMQEYLHENPVQRGEKKNSAGNLLKSSAYIHKNIENEIDGIIEKRLKEIEKEQRNYDSQSINKLSEPLTNIEFCSFNSWFRLHPEKQPGEEEITTSMFFPIRIKATKKDVIKCLENGLKSKSNGSKNNKQKRIRITKVKAKAKLKLLKLLKNN